MSSTLRSTLEAPLLRVSRPVSACSRCRNAKTKCDGKLPACSACERANRAAECSSANDQFAKGKERSYVASLETRVERLEKQLAQTRQRRSSTAMDMFNPRLTVPALHIPSGRRRVQRKEASDVDELVSDFGYLSVNATARDFHGFTKEMSFARLVLSTSSVEKMPRFANSVLPPRDHTRRLVRQCLDEVFSMYPVLTETAVYGSFEAVYQHAYTPLNWWYTCMTFAIALMSRSQSKDDELYRESVQYASMALECAEPILKPGSLAGLQAILLLVIYSMLDPSHFNSWYLIGVASRVMADIGLHQEPSEEMQVKEHQLMLRRRIFYCIYTLDRAISIAHVRAFSFSDDSANVDGPVASPVSFLSFDSLASLTERAPSTVFDPASELLKLRRIQSRWYQAVFESNREVILEPWPNRCDALGEMRSFIDTLPTNTPATLRNLFASDVAFTSMIFLRPPGIHQTICSYGKALLFDNAVSFSSATLSICQFSQSYNYCTGHDILRTLFVAHTFLELLNESPTMAFNVTEPHRPIIPTGARLPPLIMRSYLEHIDEAIATVQRLDQIVDKLDRRFRYPPKSEKYKSESAATLRMLYTRRQPQDLPYVGSTVLGMAPYRDQGAFSEGGPVMMGIPPYGDPGSLPERYLPPSV